MTEFEIMKDRFTKSGINIFQLKRYEEVIA